MANSSIPGTYNIEVGVKVLERVAETILTHGMFARGVRVGVAVSGGADSVALLHVLRELAPRWNLSLEVLHLNHKLRGSEADEDARFVEGLAGTLGLEFHGAEAEVARVARRQGKNLEEAAREARYSFFRQFLRAGTLDCVALGHTRSDQAETVIYRLLRGAGTAGLAGIRPVTRDGIVRPLIEVDRERVEKFLRNRGIGWREDVSNADLRFDRNRIRHQLLPALEREWNPNLREVLARTAQFASDEEAYWDKELERLDALVARAAASGIEIDLGIVNEQPRAVVRRLLRRAIVRVKGDLRRIDATHVEALRRLAQGKAGSGSLSLPGLRATRSFDRLRIVAPGTGTGPENFHVPLDPPARIRLPDGKTAIHLALEPKERAETTHAGGYNTRRGDQLDWDRVPEGAVLRDWRPGDRFHRAGKHGGRKLKDLFQEERIPSWNRTGWPMIANKKEIIWTRYFGVAEGYAAGAESRMVLRIWETALH